MINYKYYKKEKLSIAKIDDLIANNRLFIYCEKKRDAKAILKFFQQEAHWHWTSSDDTILCQEVDDYICNKMNLRRYKGYTCFHICNDGRIKVCHLSYCAEHEYPIVYAKDFRALINR